MTESEYKDISRFDKTITSYGEATSDASPAVDFSKYVIKEARDPRCDCGKKLNMDDKCPACDYESLADDEECRYCGSTRHSSKKCELSKPAFREELQHSQTAFVDTPAPVVSEKDCIEEIDLSDLMDTQMDDMKSSKATHSSKEKHCSECGSDLDPGSYCMSGCDDEDGKATFYDGIAEDADLDDAIFGKKTDAQKKDPDDLDLWEQEAVPMPVEPWRLVYRSLLASSRKLSEDWPDIYKDMTAKGVDGTKAMKFIRSFEATIDSMAQNLLLIKDTSRTRAQAANAMKRNPSIAEYVPKELGGAFEKVDAGSIKEEERSIENKSDDSAVEHLVSLLRDSGYDQDPTDEFSFESFSSSFDGSAYIEIDPTDASVYIKLRAAGEMGPDQLTGLFDASDLEAIKRFLGRFGFALNESKKVERPPVKELKGRGTKVSIHELKKIIGKIVKEEYDREEDGYLISLSWGQFPSREIMDRALEKGFKMTLKGMDKVIFEEAMENAGINRLEAPYMVNEPEGFKYVVQALIDFANDGADTGEDEDLLAVDVAINIATSMMDVIGIEWI